MSDKLKIKFFRYIRILIILAMFLTFSCSIKEFPILKDVAEKNEQISTEQTEKAIKNSSKLQELDNECKNIPLPPDFNFVWKGGLDDQKTSLSNYYYSETNYENSKTVFENYFSKNNGSLIKTKESNISKILEFRKEKYRIVIQYGGIGSRVNYSIYCETLEDGKLKN